LSAGRLRRDLGGGGEESPEKLGALEKGEVGGLGYGLIGLFDVLEHEQRMGGKCLWVKW